MQNFAEPLFSKGRVLKKESLEALRDFPGRLARLGLSEWADGILYGFDISYESEGRDFGNGKSVTLGEGRDFGNGKSVMLGEGRDFGNGKSVTLGEGRDFGNGKAGILNESGVQGSGKVVICAGAVWHQGQVVLTETEEIPFRAFEQQITICLRLHPASCTEDFFVRPLELRLKNGEPGNNEMELGRFRLSEGARLRKDYRDLRDCRTAYNTLDITHTPYAGPGGVTVSPTLLRMFARMVLEQVGSSDMDIQFALLCLNHPPVSRECLLWYLCRRLGEPFRELTHNEIYERLVRIAGTGGSSMGQKRKKDGPAVF